MPTFTVPGSYGTLREFNHCHSSADGKFCSTPGGVTLPEAPTRYFTHDAKTKLVPLAQIDTIRARPTGIANAEPLMRKAYDGEGSKRGPITLQPTGAGRYKVLDGNSTVAIARKHGWTSIPAHVLRTDAELAAFHTAETEKARRKTDKKLAASPSLWGTLWSYAGGRRRMREARRLREFNHCHSPEDGKFCSAPDAGGGGGGVTEVPKRKKAKPDQRFGRAVTPGLETLARAEYLLGLPISDKAKSKRVFDMLKRREPALVEEVQDLIARGHHGHPEFKQALSGIADKLGFQLHTNIEHRDVLRGDTNYVVVGGVKGPERATVKTALENDGDVRKLRDVLRGTIAVRTAAEMVSSLNELGKVAEIVHVQDNVNMPMSSGYRDVNVLVRMRRSGMLAEVQLITKPMLRAKQGKGHKIYEAWRLIKDKTAPEAQRLERRMMRLYNTAWMTSAASVAAVASLGALVSRHQTPGG